MKRPLILLALVLAVFQAAADDSAPSPSGKFSVDAQLSAKRPAPEFYYQLEPLSPKDIARAGSKHKSGWKKIGGVLSHFPLLIWNDLRPPDQIQRYEGISSQPWANAVGWHPGTFFNDDCAVHEPNFTVLSSRK